MVNGHSEVITEEDEDREAVRFEAQTFHNGDYMCLRNITETNLNAVHAKHVCEGGKGGLNGLRKLRFDAGQLQVEEAGHPVQCPIGSPMLPNGDVGRGRTLDPAGLSLNLPTSLVSETANQTEEENRNNLLKQQEGLSPTAAWVKDKLPPPRESLLLRLFESKLLDASIAITHLYKSKEPGVQTYIGEYYCSTRT